MSDNNNSTFDCCIEDVSVTVQRLVRVFQMFERDQIKIFNFTSTQCYTLLALLELKQLTMQDLADKMNLNASTMTRIVDKLVKDKLISRDRHESDRRIVVVKLTETGEEAAKKLDSSLGDYYLRILENLPENQISEVLASVELLLAAFEKANPNCC